MKCFACDGSGEQPAAPPSALVQMMREKAEQTVRKARLYPEMREALGVAAEALALPTSEAGRQAALAIVRAAIASTKGLNADLWK